MRLLLNFKMKRLLPIFILFCALWVALVPANARAATPVLIAYTVGGTLGGATTVPNAGSPTTTNCNQTNCNTTGANFCWGSWIEFDGTGVFADSKSNTWTELTPYASPSQTPNGTLHVVYVASPTVGSSHTFSVTGTNPAASISVRCYSNANASPFDTQNGDTGVGTPTSHTLPSVSPSATTNFCIVAAASAPYPSANPTNLSINSSFINPVHIDAGAASTTNVYNFFSADKITVGASEAPTISWSTGAEMTTAIACFKNAAGGGAADHQKLLMFEAN